MITTPHPDALQQERKALLAGMTTLIPALPEGALPCLQGPPSRVKVMVELEVHFPEPLAYGRFGEEADPEAEADPKEEVPPGGWWERTPSRLRLLGPSPGEGCTFGLPPQHEEALTEALQSRHATLAGVASLARRLDLQPRPFLRWQQDSWKAAAWASGLTPAQRGKGMRRVAGLFWSWLAALNPEMRPYRLRMPSAFVEEDGEGKSQIIFLNTNGPGPSMKVEVQLPPSWPSLLRGRAFIRWTSGEEPRAFRALSGEPPLPLSPLDTPSGWRKQPLADLRRGPSDWTAKFVMLPRVLSLDLDEAAYRHWTIKEREG